jgi:hypothetical protein
MYEAVYNARPHPEGVVGLVDQELGDPFASSRESEHRNDVKRKQVQKHKVGVPAKLPQLERAIQCSGGRRP